MCVPNTHVFCRVKHRLHWVESDMPRIYLERREMSEELQRLFDLLDGDAQARGSAGECSPAMDVLETAAAIEIILDLPGVEKEHVHVAVSRNTVLVAGAKGPKACAHSDA